MSHLIVSDEQALAWAHWWVQGARQAHVSWCLNDSGVTAALRDRLGDQWVDRLQDITGVLPPSPNSSLITLLQLDEAHWLRLLMLVSAICAGSQLRNTTGLEPSDLNWCLRLAKALQPGCWLPSQWQQGSPFAGSLRLLRSWVGDSVWQRLRLRFARDAIVEADEVFLDSLPALRLEALWHASTWYVLTLPLQGVSCGDTPQVDTSISPNAV